MFLWIIWIHLVRLSDPYVQIVIIFDCEIICRSSSITRVSPLILWKRSHMRFLVILVHMQNYLSYRINFIINITNESINWGFRLAVRVKLTTHDEAVPGSINGGSRCTKWPRLLKSFYRPNEIILSKIWYWPKEWWGWLLRDTSKCFTISINNRFPFW